MMKWKNLTLTILTCFLLSGCFLFQQDVVDSQQQRTLTKSDYLSLEKLTDKEIVYVVKNLEVKDLNFSRFNVRSGKGVISPVDEITLSFNVVAGGVADYSVFVWENVTKPVYGVVRTNLTENASRPGLVDVNKSHLSWNDSGETVFVSKRDVAGFDLAREIIEVYVYADSVVGSRTREEWVEFNVSRFRIPSLQERRFKVEITPIMGVLSDGTWGWQVDNVLSFKNYVYDEYAWWNTSFEKRKNLTIDNSASTENLTNFPLLVVLNSSIINYSETNDDGSDLRFVDSDESTVLDHEIDLWNESGTSYVWVEVPNIPNGSTTDFIQMFWKNSTAVSSGEDVEGTWNSNYLLVEHFDDSPDTDSATEEFIDSTSNNNDGNSSNMETTDNVAGQIGHAIDLDGVNEFIEWQNDATLNFNATELFTWQAWINYDGAAQDGSIWRTNAGTPRYLFERKSFGNDGVLNFQIVDGGSNTVSTTSGLTRDVWFLITGVRAGGLIELFVNGQSNVSSTGSSASLESTSSYRLGRRQQNDEPYDGQVDELRIISGVMSDEWIEADYLSMTNQLLTYGTTEDAPGGADTSPPVCTVTNSSITSSSARISADCNENANMSVNYGTTTALGTVSVNSSFADPVVVDLSGLSSGTLYHYNVTNCDSSGNCNITAVLFNFTTLNNTCTYGGVGDWLINMTDFCIINTNYNVSGRINFTGSFGNATFNSTLNVTNIDNPPSNTTLWVDSGMNLKVRG